MRHVTADGSAAEYPGRITFIASEAEFTPNSIETQGPAHEARLRGSRLIDDPGGFLKPGMPRDVVIETGD